jgi:hypothetical protein
MHTYALALAVLLLPAAATAQIYQWKDANGRVHYSDQPAPAAVKQERTFKPRGLAPAPVAASETDTPPASSLQQQDEDFKQRQVEKEEARAQQEKDASAEGDRKRNCEMAQGNLRNLQIGGRQVRIDPKTGERAYLSDDEIAQSVKDAQRAVDEWCKPQTAQR